MPETFADLFEQRQQLSLKPGSIIEATVVEVQPEVVIVNAGLKSEGVIPIQQFKDENGDVEVHEGDTVEVALDMLEDGYGETRLSREKAKRAKVWNELEETYEKDASIIGRIIDKVKGGFTVDLGGVTAFLPGSLVDVRPVRNMAYLQDKPLEFKIIKLDQRRNNIVLSRRAVVETEHSVEREALLKRLEEGILVKGVVKNLTDYGAFLDLGGVDGLLHITDMAWRRIKHPSEVVSIGDEIEVKVLEYDKDKQRVSLGLKQLGEDPWVDVETRYPEGSRVTGKVTNITDYGCFVEIEEGVEGLVHVSEMDWTSKNVHPAKIVSLDSELEVKVLEIDDKRRRISLGLKQCQPNPWQEFADKHKKGDKVTGFVKSLTDFGIFVGIDGFDIDGLVHMSDISWTESNEESIRKYKKGDRITVIVTSVDVERGRISLDIKQLEENPVGNYITGHPKGTVVRGTVEAIGDRSIKVALADYVKGVIPLKEFDDGKPGLEVGGEVEAKFVGFDKKKRVLNLSVKIKEREEQEKVIESYAASESGATESLGNIVKEKMQGDVGP